MTAALDLRIPKQRRALRTHAAIVDAARLEFSERGYAAATSKTIADRAGVSVGSLYQYFEDKDHVLRHLAQQRAEQIAEQTLSLLEEPTSATVVDDLRARVRERLRLVVLVVVEQHRHDPGLHAVLTERRHLDVALDAITSAFERGLVERGEALLQSWGHPGDCLATSFVLFTLVEGAVHTQVLGEAIVSDERMFDALLDALVRIALPPTRGS
jgi:AcrR family transcriptional regulator